MHSNTHIQDLHPYQPGLSNEAIAQKYGFEPSDVIKLASNENPLGPSPRAVTAVQGAMQSAERYPDGGNLSQAIAAHYGLQSGQVTLGNGSNDVLDLIARVFLAPGTNAVSSQYGFVVYQLVTRLAGGGNIVVDAHEYGHDLPSMLAAITVDTRVIWVANPNNPTGTFLSYEQVRHFLQDCPEHVVVVLDEAYYEYLDIADQTDTTRWLTTFPNLIIVRTFSKMYGLAGMRVGYALASVEITDLLNRVRQPFNVSTLGLAGAIAALGDMDHITRSKAVNTVGLAYLQQQCDALGLAYIPSWANFLTIRFPDAMGMFEQLLRQGIIVRPLQPYGLLDYLRVTVGTADENERVMAAIAQILT